MFERFCEEERGEKPRFFKGFRRFGFFPSLGGVTRSQTKRDTKLRESRMHFIYYTGWGGEMQRFFEERNKYFLRNGISFFEDF